MRTLRTKIALASSILTFVTTTAIGYLYISKTEQEAVGSETHRISGTAERLALNFANIHQRIADDLFLVSQASSTQNLFTEDAFSNGGLSPEGELTKKKSQLAELFRAILVARTQYTQIELIDLENGAQEMVRVVRTPEGIIRTRDEDLRKKDAARYLQATLEHQWQEVDHPHQLGSHILFSDVSYNGEPGNASEPKTATVRAVLPLFSGDHNVFALIVATADYEELLKVAFDEITPNSEVFIVSNSGDYLTYFPDRTISDIEFHGEYTKPLPEIVGAALNSDTAAKNLVSRDTLSHFVRIGLSKEQPDVTVAVAYQVPHDDALPSVGHFGRDYFTLVLLSIIAMTGAAHLIATRLMKPLKELEEKVRNANSSLDGLDLPVEAKDEIGALARSFRALISTHVDATSRLASIIDHIGEGIITMDINGRVESFNPACERIFGHSADEVVGKNIRMLMPMREGRSHDQYLKRYASDGNRKIDWRGRIEAGLRSDGTEFPIELTITELSHDGQRLLIGIVRDITKQRVAETAKNAFIATVSHELRTPLTSIKGALALCLSGTGGVLPPKVNSLLAIAHRNSDRLVALINDILDIEKIESEKMDFKLSKIDLSKLVEDAVAANAGYGDSLGVSYVTSGTDTPITINGNVNRLMQLMDNLLSNASKFSESGGQVQVSVSVGGPYARVSIADTGCGIPEAAKATIFDKFTQADPSDSRKKGGTGLGLTIAKAIVERHGGTIGFTTKETVGTTFFVDLPIQSR